MDLSKAAQVALLGLSLALPGQVQAAGRTPPLSELAATAFEEPLIATAATSRQEDDSLRREIGAYRIRASPDDFRVFDPFLIKYPASEWRVGLLTNFASGWREVGRAEAEKVRGMGYITAFKQFATRIKDLLTKPCSAVQHGMCDYALVGYGWYNFWSGTINTAQVWNNYTPPPPAVPNYNQPGPVTLGSQFPPEWLAANPWYQPTINVTPAVGRAIY